MAILKLTLTPAARSYLEALDDLAAATTPGGQAEARGAMRAWCQVMCDQAGVVPAHASRDSDAELALAVVA